MFSAQANIFLILFSLFPTLLVIFLFGEDMETELTVLSVYVFTRTKKRAAFIGKRLRKTAFEIACIYLISLLAIAVISMLYTADLRDSHPVFLILVVLSSYLQTVVLVFLQNILTLRIPATVSFLLVSCFYSLSILFLVFANPEITKISVYFLPFTQGIYSWHDRKVLEFSNLANNTVPGFTVEYSFLFLLAFIGLEHGISFWLIKNMDFLGGTNG